MVWRIEEVNDLKQGYARGFFVTDKLKILESEREYAEGKIFLQAFLYERDRPLLLHGHNLFGLTYNLGEGKVFGIGNNRDEILSVKCSTYGGVIPFRKYRAPLIDEIEQTVNFFSTRLNALIGDLLEDERIPQSSGEIRKLLETDYAKFQKSVISSFTHLLNSGIDELALSNAIKIQRIKKELKDHKNRD